MKIKCLIFCSLILFCQLLEGQTTLSERIALFEASLAYYKEQLQLPGLSVIILKDQQVIWESAMGFADIENEIKASPSTVYQLASVTKPMAGMALLGLVDDGEISLSEPLHKYAPDLDPAGEVRLEHLLTHTSEGTPGSYWNYNGNLYSRLDVAVKARSEPLRDLCKRRIFETYGMSSTIANPLDPELLIRFGNYLIAHDEEPVIYRSGKKKYEIAKLDLSDYKREPYERSYWLATVLLTEAIHASGIDSSIFKTFRDHDIDRKTIDQFVEFYRTTEAPSIEVLKSIAKPYVYEMEKGLKKGRYNLYFGGGAGFNSTVQDLALFDIALDNNQLISAELKAQAFKPYVLNGGGVTPYGYGWFSQRYNGIPIIWHGGEWDCASALYMKVPTNNLTLIVLCNSRMMSGAFAMGEGDITNSGIALDFFKYFVLDEAARDTSICWYDSPDAIVDNIIKLESDDLRRICLKQVQVIGLMHMQMGRTEFYNDVLKVIREKGCVPAANVDDNSRCSGSILAELKDIGNDEERSVVFHLNDDTSLHVYAIGEGIRPVMYDYGWITNESGEVVWRMNFDKSLTAGGSTKNRLVDTRIDLPAGDYRLYYKTDNSHSYLLWNAPAPDHWYWGIKVWLE